MVATVTQVPNVIGGEHVAPSTGNTGTGMNPARPTQAVAESPRSGRKDALQAIEAAKAAFPAWDALGGPARADILMRTAKIIRERAESIAREFTMEEGKPIRDSRAEVYRAAQIFEFYAAEGWRAGGDTLPSARKDVFLHTLRIPLGVVAVLTPWNFPIAIPSWKIAPALIMGNTVVFKPASNTPLTAFRLVEALHDAGLPPGVLNTVVGSGSEVGEEFVTNPDVAAVTFTGSTEVGQSVYQKASARMARVQCEMGGKNPLVVLDDADLDLAASLAVEGAFNSTGQKCSATSRVIVQRSVAQELADRIIARSKALKVGDGLEEDTYVGPVVDEQQYNDVLRYIDIGTREGASLQLDGRRSRTASDGYFVGPTVFTDCRSEMVIAQEEIFGPVVAILPADSYEEAMKIANDTQYGLTASICTRSLSKANRFAREMKAGTVGVNVPTAGIETQAPFGGQGQSGSPFKELGTAAISFYSTVKAVAMYYGE